MDISSHIADTVRSHIGYTIKSQKGWEQRNCMMCHLNGESHDTRRRMGIMFSPDGSIGVKCFNCRFTATYTPGHSLSLKFQKLMQEIGISDYEIKKINFEIFRSHGTSTSSVLAVSTKITNKWVEMPLPEESHTLAWHIDNNETDPNFMTVLEYAYNRGLTDINSLYWSPKKDGHLTNKRVIIPFTYDNKIVGYTGRLCVDPPNKSISKYINKFPIDYIYNIDVNRSHLRNTILITEGVIDAYLMDGISTCGNTISQAQIDYINSLKKRVIVCPDFDKDGYVLVEVAVKNGWEVSIPNWKREIKDAAQASLVYGRILTLESILSSTESSLIAINLKWKARVK